MMPRAGMHPHDMLEALVRIRSDSGDEADAARWLCDQGRLDGFDASIDEAGNVILRTGRGAVRILFVGHIDTVPGGPAPLREPDRMWGRGSVDAKGCLVAAYTAMRDLADDTGVQCTFVAAVGEETDSAGMRALDLDEAPHLIINGEPSGWDGLTIAYKGIVRGCFEITGRPVHAGHPDEGVLDRAVTFWYDVRSRFGVAPGFDQTSARLDGLRRSERGRKELAHAEFQLRLPPGLHPDDVVARLDALATQHDVSLEIDEAVPAAQSSPRSAVAGLFRGAIREQGGQPRILRKTGTADFNLLAQRFPDVPIIAYGPGDSSLDHTPEEHLRWDDLDQAIAVWQAALAAAPRRLALTA